MAPASNRSGRSSGWACACPIKHELEQACAALQFDEVSPSEILTPHERPVLTVDGPTVQIVLRTARYDDHAESVALGEMTLLVAPKSIVSIRHGQASQLAPVRAALELDPDRLRLGPMAVLTAVIGRVVGDYGPALDGFEHDVVEAELDVFTDIHRQPVERLYRLKREVRRTLVAFDALQDPLNRLIRALNQRIPEELIADLNEVRRSARPGGDPGDLALGAARRGTHREPDPDHGAAEQRHAQDQRLGGDGGRPDDDRRDLRHELRFDAGTRFTVRLSDRAGRDGRHRRVAVPVLQTQRLALNSVDLDHHFAEGAPLAHVAQRVRYLIEPERAVDVDGDVAGHAQVGERLEMRRPLMHRRADPGGDP